MGDSLDFLHRISEALARSAEREQPIPHVLQVVQEEMGVVRATVLLLSVDGERLIYDGTSHADTARRPEIAYRPGEGMIGRVMEQGTPIAIPDIAAEPSFRNRIHQRSEREASGTGFVCVPILEDSRVIGALSVDVPASSRARVDAHARVLRVVASMIAHHVHMRRDTERERQMLEKENRRLRAQIADASLPGDIVGTSDAMRSLALRIRQAAPSDTTVLIRGESGTGKELVARAIYRASNRADAPYVTLNCAALSEHLLESELFGHEKGAFTGALQERVGRLEEADGGTLFLDEIGEFAPGIQVKLLRVLQEKEFSRVGSNGVRKVDIRFIVATNRNLEEAVEAGEFRQDFYYRINVFPLMLPPLRDRREDILPLANHFTEAYARKMNKPVRRISTTTIETLLAYHWPGNVRELENCIEHAVLLCEDDAIQSRHLPPTLAMPTRGDTAPVGSLVERVERLERDMIMDALKRNEGNISASARELGITPRMVRYKLQKLQIRYRQFFP